jgi:hypothetical protein
MMGCYNARHNSPYKEGQHLQYTRVAPTFGRNRAPTDQEVPRPNVGAAQPREATT